MSSDSGSDSEIHLWTSASSDSPGSEFDMASEKVKEKRKKTNSESDKEVKNELLNNKDYTLSDIPRGKPDKTRKRKIKEEPEDSDRASPAIKKIKTEYTSDTEVRKKKKKKKDKDKIRETRNDTYDAVDYSKEEQAAHENFLNQYVKEEIFATPSPIISKKKHKKNSTHNASCEQSDTDADSSRKNKSKKKRNLSISDNTLTESELKDYSIRQEEIFAGPSPVISKKETKKNSTNNTSYEEPDTVPDSSRKKKSKKQRNQSITDNTLRESEQKDYSINQEEIFAKTSPVISKKEHKKNSTHNASIEQSDTDADPSRKKKSKKKRNHSITDNTLRESEQKDYSINQEEIFAKPSPVISRKEHKKNSTKNTSSKQSNIDTDSSRKNKSKKKRIQSITDNTLSESEQMDYSIKQELLNAASESDNSKKSIEKEEKEYYPSNEFVSDEDSSSEDAVEMQKSPIISKKERKRNSTNNASTEQSDIETHSSKKKKSKKKRNQNITDNTLSESEQKDYSIKQELLNATSELENSKNSIEKKGIKDYPSNELVSDEDSSSDNALQTPVAQKNAQKKKSKDSLNVSFVSVGTDKSIKNKNQNPSSKINGHVSDVGSSASSGEGNNEPPSRRRNTVSSSSMACPQKGSDSEAEPDHGRSGTTDFTNSLLNATAPAIVSRRRISERIAFEDDDDSESELEDKNNDQEDQSIELPVSAGVNMYLLKHTTLKQVTTLLPNDNLISDDDDIWIIKCPHEVNINSMNGLELALESKCKIRVNDQTYDGNIEEDNNRLTMLSCENKKYVIKNFPVKGTIRFRKRIPKPHMRVDNIMPNNQTNFILLPETKCRHPLFGINYKPALKLSSAVAQRLRGEGENADFAKPAPSKKRRKHRESVTKEEPDSELEMVPKKKKRKHKHTDSDDETPTKSKRIKRDPDAAEAWESEQAIEENLFNF